MAPNPSPEACSSPGRHSHPPQPSNPNQNLLLDPASLQTEIASAAGVRTKSWSSIFKTLPPSAGEADLQYVEPTYLNGILQIEDEILQEGAKEMEQTVVGYFLDKKLPYTVVQEKLKELWKIQGSMDISLDGELYYFKFNNQVDRLKVIEGGSLIMAGKPFIIAPWTPEIEEGRDAIKTIPLWVRIFKVPKHLWNPKGLSRIASTIGKPKFLDKNTERKNMLSFARVCVEIEAGKELPKTMPVKTSATKWVEVEFDYPWKPYICSKCKVFGHETTTCGEVIPARKPQWQKKNDSKGREQIKEANVEKGNGGKEGKKQYEPRQRQGTQRYVPKQRQDNAVPALTTENPFQVIENLGEDTLEEDRSVTVPSQSENMQMPAAIDMQNPQVTSTNGQGDSIINGINQNVGVQGVSLANIQPSSPSTTPNLGDIIQPPLPSNVSTTVSISLEEGEIADNGGILSEDESIADEGRNQLLKEIADVNLQLEALKGGNAKKIPQWMAQMSAPRFTREDGEPLINLLPKGMKLGKKKR